MTQQIDITLDVLRRDPANEEYLRLAYFHRLGLARILKVEDQDYSFDKMQGDSYNPAAHPDIPAEQLAKEKTKERRRLREQGAWGGAIQVRKTSQDPWVRDGCYYLDSIWGFIGDDYVGSGYDGDQVAMALEWLDENGAIDADPQAALVGAAKAALLLLRKVQAEQPGVFPSMRDNVEPSLVMAELGAIVDRYNVSL